MSSTFHINTFRSRWEGGARPTLFKVRIPTLPPDISQEQLGDLEVFVKATTLPSFIVQPITMNYMGAPLQYAGNRVYQNWTVTVLNDENFVYRDMFEAWSNKTLSLISNRQTAVDNLVDYKVDSQVLQYGKAGPGDDSGIVDADKPCAVERSVGSAYFVAVSYWGARKIITFVVEGSQLFGQE